MTRRVAFYYPGPRVPGELKNMLLFFDAVALLVPDHLQAEVAEQPDARALIDAGLLLLLRPDELMTLATAGRLSEIIREIAGVLPGRDASTHDDWARISWSRLGYEVNPGVAELVSDLAASGLASSEHDDVDAYLRRDVRDAVFLTLSYLLADANVDKGLIPTTASLAPALVFDQLAQVVGGGLRSDPWQVAASDLQTLGVDVRNVHVRDLLMLRDKHLKAFRAYADDVAQSARRLSSLSPKDRQDELQDRARAITDGVQPGGWKSPAGMVLAATTIVDAGVSAATGTTPALGAVSAAVVLAPQLLALVQRRQRSDSPAFLIASRDAAHRANQSNGYFRPRSSALAHLSSKVAGVR